MKVKGARVDLVQDGRLQTTGLIREDLAANCRPFDPVRERDQ